MHEDDVKNILPDHAAVLLGMQRALLGNITDDMCSVMVAFTAGSLTFRARFASSIQIEQVMRVSEIETELIADFPLWEIKGVAEECSFPEKIMLSNNETLVFSRAPD
ncbi:hypothetical protein [Roseateles chitinivorans]|uniref:hypothetical protein n=1 Tax=Roseateles chitinivorans TaxID=2917965 RepID=UPI003D671E5F